MYSFFQLLAWLWKDWEHGNIFFHTAVANRMHVPGDSNSEGKRQFPLPAEKSYVTFAMCRSSAKTKKKTATSPRVAKEFWKSVLANTSIHPLRQSNTSRTSVWVKRFQNYRSVRRSAKKGNASQLQTTLEWISELVCSAVTCILEATKFWYHLPDWNLWFFKVTFLGWVLNFVGGSLWDLPLCLKLGSQIVPQPGPSKVEKKAGPPHGSSAVFLVASQFSRAADFKNHFPNSILRCHSLC